MKAIKEDLQKIKPYLREILNNFSKSDTRKIQLVIAINFIFSKDTDEEHVKHTKGDNIELMI